MICQLFLKELADIDPIKTFTHRTPSFGRQVSESSQYTTDTHETGSGKTAHLTAVNTLQNTMRFDTRTPCCNLLPLNLSSNKTWLS